MFRLRHCCSRDWRMSNLLLRPALRVVWLPFASAAKTLYVLWVLTCRLAHLLGSSPRWMILCVRLVVFSVLISPALLQLVPYYVLSSTIRRGVRYGPHRRNDFDVHAPLDATVRFGPRLPSSEVAPSARPVVILFAGGAWMIGYKLWTLALCRTLASLGIVAVACDYRNYPQVTASGMVEDVSAAISAVFASPEVAAAGGDPRLVYLWGQSAGAHLAACAIIERAVCETLESRAAAASMRGPAALSLLPSAGLSSSRSASSVSLVRLVHCGVDPSAEFDDYVPPSLSEETPQGSGYGRGTPSQGAGSAEHGSSAALRPGPESPGLQWGSCSPARAPAGQAGAFHRRGSGGAFAPHPAIPAGLPGKAELDDMLLLRAEDGGAGGGGDGLVLRRRVLDFPAAAGGGGGGGGAALLAYEEVLVAQGPLPLPRMAEGGEGKGVDGGRSASTLGAAAVEAAVRPPGSDEQARHSVLPTAAAALAPPPHPRVRRFFGVSGAYDVGAIAPSFQVRYMMGRREGGGGGVSSAQGHDHCVFSRAPAAPASFIAAAPAPQAKAGVPASFIDAIFEGSLDRYSPQVWFAACAAAAAAGAGGGGAPTAAAAAAQRASSGAFPPLDPARMPPVSLFHGSADACVPASASVAFAATLAAAGVPAAATVFRGGGRMGHDGGDPAYRASATAPAPAPALRPTAGKSHTDPVVEDPLGGSEPLLEAMLAHVWDDMGALAGSGGGARAEQPGGAVKPEGAALLQREQLLLQLHGAVGALVPRPFLALARWVNPFN